MTLSLMGTVCCVSESGSGVDQAEHAVHSPALYLCFSMSCNDSCPGCRHLSHNLHCLLKTLLLAGGEGHYQKTSQFVDISAVAMERGRQRLL